MYIFSPRSTIQETIKLYFFKFYQIVNTTKLNVSLIFKDSIKLIKIVQRNSIFIFNVSLAELILQEMQSKHNFYSYLSLFGSQETHFFLQLVTYSRQVSVIRSVSPFVLYHLGDDSIFTVGAVDYYQSPQVVSTQNKCL